MEVNSLRGQVSTFDIAECEKLTPFKQDISLQSKFFLLTLETNLWYAFNGLIHSE